MHILRKSILLSSSYLLSHTYKCNNNNNKTDIKQELPSWIGVKQMNANNPIEDRVAVSALMRGRVYAVSVFDGHGGDLCADYVAHNMERCLSQAYLRQAKNSSINLQVKMKNMLEEAYDELESGFKAIFSNHIQDIDYQRVGACALTAILCKDFAITANSGDCEAAFLQVGPLKNKPPIKLTKRLNAGEPSEQKRLKEEFPKEQDIVKCIQGTNYCYVKDRLQPTRSFGDFYLKSPEYNFTKLQTFTGPYITHKPVISIHNYRRELGHVFVMGTDGLWDELDIKEMDNLLTNKADANPAEVLFQGAVSKILDRTKIKSVEQLQKMPNRRDLHDDISVVTVNMLNFLEYVHRYI